MGARVDLLSHCHVTSGGVDEFCRSVGCRRGGWQGGGWLWRGEGGGMAVAR
jgi:hypothetical protein